MNTQELKKIAEKIAKCLALGESTNPHEAETAQRQAKALMEKYSLSSSDVAAAPVHERTSKTGTRFNTPLYLCTLASITARAFSCDAINSPGGGYQGSVIKFLGVGAKPELAAYTFDVLRRRLIKDRAAYYATLKRFKPSNRIRNASIFCDAWLFGVQKQVSGFAGNTDELIAIACYKKKHYAHTIDETRSRTDVTEHDHKAITAGILASKDVALHRPVRSKGGKAITHQESV